MYKIYVLKDPRTNEVRYVGCSKNVEQRYKAHNNKARDLNTAKRLWIGELRELGLKPIMEILEEVNSDNYLLKEKEYINTYRTLGANLTNTGIDNTHGNTTAFKKGHNSIKVVALTLEGSFYNSYNSVLEASIENNISNSNISSVLTKKTKTAGNLIWIYEDDYYKLSEIDINNLTIEALDRSNSGGKQTRFKKGHESWIKGKNIKIKPDKHVFQYSAIDGSFIKEWNTAKEASIELSCNPEGIGQCCRGNSKTAGGFIWKYKYYDSVEVPIFSSNSRKDIIKNLK